MANFEFKYRRYAVMAKRKNIDEPWTDWTNVDDYESAVKHANHVEELGYSAKIIDRGEKPNE